MKGDRVEAWATRARAPDARQRGARAPGAVRIEVITNARVEAREVTRTGVPVRTGRFMTSRLIALVEHPAGDARGRVEVSTRHRLAAEG